MQQYVFDQGTKEFELTGPQDTISMDKLEVFLKAEGKDETCSIIK